MSPQGFWLLLGGRELFVPFDEFAWFRDASVGQITDVEQPSDGHLSWPQLDIDLTVDSIEHPARYPLVSRAETGARKPAADAAAVRERGPACRSPRQRRAPSRRP